MQAAAAEEAARDLDFSLKREICDNQWLLEELATHQRQYQTLTEQVSLIKPTCNILCKLDGYR